MALQLNQRPNITPNDEAIRVLVISLATLVLLRRRRRQKRQWKWRPLYEYTQSSFSLDLMPPGRARSWLRFDVPEIIELALLLQLYRIKYRERI